MRLYHPNSGFIESDRSTDVSNLLSNGWVEVVTTKTPDYSQENTSNSNDVQKNEFLVKEIDIQPEKRKYQKRDK